MTTSLFSKLLIKIEWEVSRIDDCQVLADYCVKNVSIVFDGNFKIPIDLNRMSKENKEFYMTLKDTIKEKMKNKGDNFINNLMI